MARTSFAARVLDWYVDHARSLPWRKHHDPYRVWISEIMLQQTRVDTVIPYFRRWMRRFPTVKVMAAASEADVLGAWEGLGYYARARHLRKAAQIVVSEFGGKIPSDLGSLQSLPGVGRYTAGAIASIAFGLDAPALDGNIRRVLARVFNVNVLADSAAGRSHFWQLAGLHLPHGRAGDYNQALMDLGATICLPQQPKCGLCPVRGLCSARRLGITRCRPVLRPRKSSPLYAVGAAVVMRRGRVLLARRESKGLLGGLWEFPSTRLRRATSSGRHLGAQFVDRLERDYGVRVRPDGWLCQVRHAYTHFRVDVAAHSCEFVSSRPHSPVRWIRVSELPRYPMGKVDRQIALRLATGPGS